MHSTHAYMKFGYFPPPLETHFVNAKKTKKNHVHFVNAKKTKIHFHVMVSFEVFIYLFIHQLKK